MKKIYLLIIPVVLLAAFFFFYHPIITQEGNPGPVATGIIKLELSGEEIVPLPGRLLLQKAGPITPLKAYLAGYGWIYSDQLGSGIFFQRRGEELFVHARMLTRRYVVYESDRLLN